MDQTNNDVPKKTGTRLPENRVQRWNQKPSSTAKPSIWVPGFSWIEYSGGSSAGITAGDMYENGNRIGIMH
ncbi:MAG: DUF6550 family protein [Bacillota bacterium]